VLAGLVLPGVERRLGLAPGVYAVTTVYFMLRVKALAAGAFFVGHVVAPFFYLVVPAEMNSESVSRELPLLCFAR
jgi:hypothetical protein